MENLRTEKAAHRAALLVVLLSFGGLAYLVAPRSPASGTVSVVGGDMDATQQCLLIEDGIDKVAGKSLSYYNTTILYPDRTQLRSTEPFLGYVLLGLPLRLVGLDGVQVFEVERWVIVFASLVYAWLLLRALGVEVALAAAGAVLCVSQPGMVSGIERLQCLSFPLVLAGVYHALRASQSEGRLAWAHRAGLFASAAIYPLLGVYNATIVLLAGLLLLPFLVQAARELRRRGRLASIAAPVGLAAVVDVLLLAPWLLDRADMRAYTEKAFLEIKHWQSTALPLRLAHVSTFLGDNIGTTIAVGLSALAALEIARRLKDAWSGERPREARAAWPSRTHLAMVPLAALPILFAAAFGLKRETMPALGFAFDIACCVALFLHFRGLVRLRFDPDNLAGNAALLALGLAVFLSLMSFGPAYASNGHPLETGIARAFMVVLPALESMREWSRIWLFAMLALAVYVTLRLNWLLHAAGATARAAVVAAIVLAMLWTLHERVLVATPPVEADAGVVALASKSMARGPIYIHPYTEWNSRVNVVMVANAARLRRPTFNGCLGVCPPWWAYASGVLRRFPDPETLWLLRKWKVQTVVGMGGGLGEPPPGIVKVFEDGQGRFVCDILPPAVRLAHPSEARPASRALARVETRFQRGRSEVAGVEVPAGFVVHDVELHFRLSVVNLVPDRVEVFGSRPGEGRVRLNEGQSGEWLQSLAADCLLHREAPVITVALATLATRTLELRFGAGGASGLDRVVLLGEWSPRRGATSAR